MIPAAILPLVFLFAATSVLAQQSVTPASSTSIVLKQPRTEAAECPLGMRARHGAGVPVGISAGSSQSPIAPHAPAHTQKIHLTMTNLLAHEIVGAQFVIRGFSARSRAMNLADSSQAPDLAKTVAVALDVKGQGEASSDFSMSRFAAVTSIEVSSITYADGNTWHSPSPMACSITPDLVMLVASTR